MMAMSSSTSNIYVRAAHCLRPPVRRQANWVGSANDLCATWPTKSKRIATFSSLLPGPFSHYDDVSLNFNGSRSWSTSVPFDPSLPSFPDYMLDSPLRIFRASFGDSERLEDLGEGRFRVRMLPLHFLNLTVTPIVILCVQSEKMYESAKLHLTCHEITLLGVAPEDSKPFQLHLQGELTGSRRGEIFGRVVARIETSVPSSLVMTPPSVLEMTGNLLVAHILAMMNDAMERRFVRDYYSWCQSKCGEGGNNRRF